MDLDLAGKTAVVTGASRGIGLAIAQALTDEGVRVVGGARTVTPELEKASVAAVSADLGTAEGVTTLIDTALTELGGLDILVNNVGGGDAERFQLGSFLDIADDQWLDLFELNVMSAVRASRAALPSLIERRGSIVNISSINSRLPAVGPTGYSEAKAALTSFSKRISEEFGPQGVRVNTVSPGVTGSSIWRDPNGFGAKLAAASGVGHEEFLASITRNFGMTSDRITEPEEVGSLVAFLVSGQSANIIGADVVIDGGTLKTM
ncbi:SDR family oxidoreductase [Nocardia alni]|uniref:SDR family oxidoreductase n=1 Tax=Nocardia alni TaxID=2815723 RepID=UPI001C24DAD8|nr:SDR family oxidoreductase [Nocardia alni]